MTSTLHVNGQDFDVEIRPHETLADVLRDKLGLIGVKVSCGEGECGSCTILVDGIPCTACLMLGRQGEGHELVTVEGIGGYENLHPIQQAFIDDPTEEEVSTAMSGNICRCGAYPYIVKSVLKAAEDIRNQQR